MACLSNCKEFCPLSAQLDTLVEIVIVLLLLIVCGEVLPKLGGIFFAQMPICFRLRLQRLGERWVGEAEAKSLELESEELELEARRLALESNTSKPATRWQLHERNKEV